MRSAFRVIRTVRENMPAQNADAIVRAPRLRAPGEAGYRRTGADERVLTLKVCRAHPLYRQSEIYGRRAWNWTVHCCRAGWMHAAGCCPRWRRRFRDYVLTTVNSIPMIPRSGAVAGAIRRRRPGGLWTYVRDDRNARSALAPAVWFAYSPRQKKASIRRPILRGSAGVLQADAYAGFNELYRDGRITKPPAGLTP